MASRLHLHLGPSGYSKSLFRQQLIPLFWFQLLPIAIVFKTLHALIVTGGIFVIELVEFVA